MEMIPLPQLVYSSYGLFAKADAALYAAKEGGRNQVMDAGNIQGRA